MRRYDDEGSGPAVVLTPGMLMDRRMYTPQIEPLKGAYRTIALDHRSMEGEGAPFDLYDLAADVCATLDALDIERCVLVGMSMGGFMGLRFALRYPERLAGLVLIGASAVPYPQAEREHWAAHFRQHRSDSTLRESFARGEAAAHFSEMTRDRRPALVDEWARRFAARRGIDTWHETLSWLHQDDVRDQLGSVTCPVLLVRGDEDDAVPGEAVAETASLLTDARQLVVPWAGHAVNLEAPQAVNEALERFLHRVWSNAGA